MSRLMRRGAAAILLALGAVSAKPYFIGEPHYADAEAQRVAEAMLEAHGGVMPWLEAESFGFRFVTKVVGGGGPLYSIERTDLSDGAAVIEWPWMGARTGWDGEEAWSVAWPMPLPPGFFTHLTTSFITLPWLTQHDLATVASRPAESIPDVDGEQLVLRVTFAAPGPHVPGNYYDVFVDPESYLLRAVRFDITHPGMVANPEQPIGPNLHIFSEYRNVGGLVFPTYYYTYGQRGGEVTTEAVHMVFGIRLDQPLDRAEVAPPSDAVIDESTSAWWGD